MNDGTTTIKRAMELFPKTNIVPMSTGEATLASLVSGTCIVLWQVDLTHDIAKNSVHRAGLVCNYEIGTNRYLNESLVIVTHQDDAAWSDFVYWVVEAIFHAEKNGVTKATAKEMPSTNLLGPF